MSFYKIVVVISLIFLNYGTFIAQATKSDTTIIEDKYYGDLDFKKGVELFEQHQSAEARTFLLKANETFIEEENWDAALLATKYLIVTWRGADDYQDGIAFGENTIDLIKEKAPDKFKDTHVVIHELAILYDISHERRKAEELFLEELDIVREKYVIDTSGHFAITYHCLAIVESHKGNLDGTIDFFSKALQSYSTARDYSDERKEQMISNTYGGLAIAHSNKGDITKAIEYYEKEIKIKVKHLGENHLRLSRAYYNIATLYYDISQYEVSNQYLDKAEFIIDRSETNNKEYSVIILSSIYQSSILNLFALDKVDEVEDYIVKYSQINDMTDKQNQAFVYLLEAKCSIAKQEYEGIEEKLLNIKNLLLGIPFEELQKRSTIIDTYVELGKLKAVQKEYAISRKYFEDGLELIRLRGGQGDEETAMISLAQSYEKETQIDSALIVNYFALSKNSSHSDKRDALPSVLQVQSLSNPYKILNQRGKLFQKKAELATSSVEKKNALDEALITYKFSDAVHKRKLSKSNLFNLSSSEDIISKSMDLYRDAISVAGQLYNFEKERSYINDAFDLTQKMKSQHLWSSILETEAKSLGNLSAEQFKKEEQLLRDISYYETKLQQAIEKKDSVNIALYGNKYLFESKEEYRKLLVGLEDSNPAYYSAKYDFAPTTPDEINDLLNSDEVLIEYVFTSPGELIAIVIDDQSMSIKQIAVDSTLSELVRSFNRYLKNSPMAKTSSHQRFIQQSHKLYNQFIKPIEEHLVGKKSLVIVGDGISNLVPFEVLLSSDETLPYSDLGYLINDYEITYHYSSTLFAHDNLEESNYANELYAFAPVYDHLSNDALALNVPGQDLANATLRAMDDKGNFQSLPMSEVETQSIIELFESKDLTSTKLDLRKDASESSLKEALEKSYKYIHIAGHSFANTNNPKFSGIACYDNSTMYPTEQDGILYTGEIYNINISADLITLSSCESGYGKLDNSEGLLGLNRAFIYAGADNVVYSLWKVYDKVSASLMTDFYTSVLDGKGYASALRKAKLKVISEESTASPHFWSPFLYIGKGSLGL